MGVLAIASTAVQPATTHTGKHTRAAAGTGSATAIAEPTRSPPSAPSAQPRAVAATVAQAYARYLDGQLPARRLPALTPQALATARSSGPLPARLHVTQVRLTSLTGGGDAWTAHFAIRDTRGRQTTTAQLVLSATDGPWKLAELIPPDPDILITPNPPALPPTGPAAARHAALEFTHSYLDYTYDHPAADQLRDLTPGCESRSPPTRPRCRQTFARCTPASQASRSHATAHAGWQTRTSPTDKTPTRSPASWPASTATGSSSRCDPQDESVAPAPTTLGREAARSGFRLPNRRAKAQQPARSTFAARPLRAHRRRADSLERQKRTDDDHARGRLLARRRLAAPRRRVPLRRRSARPADGPTSTKAVVAEMCGVRRRAGPATPSRGTRWSSPRSSALPTRRSLPSVLVLVQPGSGASFAGPRRAEP